MPEPRGRQMRSCSTSVRNDMFVRDAAAWRRCTAATSTSTLTVSTWIPRPGGDAKPIAVEKLVAQLPLKPADLRAHPGLGHMHSYRRLGETGLLGDRHQVLKLVKLHN